MYPCCSQQRDNCSTWNGTTAVINNCTPKDTLHYFLYSIACYCLDLIMTYPGPTPKERMLLCHLSPSQSLCLAHILHVIIKKCCVFPPIIHFTNTSSIATCPCNHPQPLRVIDVRLRLPWGHLSTIYKHILPYKTQ